MYKEIENDSVSIIQSLNGIHVTHYNWLKINLYLRDVSSDLEYQKKYRFYWRMRYVSPISNFNIQYFNFLENNKMNEDIDLAKVCRALSVFATDGKNEKFSFQLSFITKLIHMIDRDFPIFDSKIRDFYHLPLIPSSSDLEQKIIQTKHIIDLIKKEQNSIVDQGFLTKSIKNFRSVYPESEFSDRKIIDTMIWAFVSKDKAVSRNS